jgi:hypothetical protein
VHVPACLCRGATSARARPLLVHSFVLSGVRLLLLVVWLSQIDLSALRAARRVTQHCWGQAAQSMRQQPSPDTGVQRIELRYVDQGPPAEPPMLLSPHCMLCYSCAAALDGQMGVLHYEQVSSWGSS